jgi:hypothetical protein
MDLEAISTRWWFVGRLIRAKYLGDRDLFAGEVPTKGSQFWNSLQKIKWYFKLGARHKVRNGKITYFWSDWWIGNAPSRDRFPLLYSCCLNPHIMVSGVHSSAGWRVGFRRRLGLAEKVEWDNLCRKLHMDPSSSTFNDEVSWRMEPSGAFTAKSIYSVERQYFNSDPVLDL